MENHLNAEADRNSKILKITLKIKNHYPELSKYLEEMTLTKHDEVNGEIAIRDLKSYYDTLNSMLNKYLLEHPEYHE